MEFAPEKSELLHFSRAHANCELLLRLGAVIMRSITNARFLGVWRGFCEPLARKLRN
jgi:hypothetical protein